MRLRKNLSSPITLQCFQLHNMVFKQTAVIDNGIWDFASFYETPVRFSLKYCDYSGKFCISKISDNTERKLLYGVLWHFEDMTWRQLQSLEHKKGISIEKKWSNYDLFLKEICAISNIRNPTIWHFRYWSSSLGRVFWFIHSWMFYIFKIDANWKVNH